MENIYQLLKNDYNINDLTLFLENIFSVPYKYHFFDLKTKNKIRKISKPNKEILPLLYVFKTFFEDLYIPSNSAHAFIKNRGIITNAKTHVNNNFVFNIDLNNFFGSIIYENFLEIVSMPPYNISKNDFNNFKEFIFIEKDDQFVLPQGSPLSPILSNIYCDNLDKELLILASSYNLNYTRYADDLTFSGQVNEFNRTSPFRKKLNEILKKYQFNVNHKKTRLQKKQNLQSVTGISVNKKIAVSKKYREKLRMELYLIRKYGVEKISENYGKTSEQFSNYISGKISFCKGVENMNIKTSPNLGIVDKKITPSFDYKKISLNVSSFKHLINRVKKITNHNPVAEIAKYIDQKNFEFLDNVLNSSIDVYGNMDSLSTMFFYLTNEKVEGFLTVDEILNPSKENPLSSSITSNLKQFLTEFYEEKKLELNEVSNLDIELQLNILRNRLSENFNISNTEISLKNNRSIEEITVALYIPIVRKFFNYFSKTQGNKDVLQSLLDTLDNYYLHKSTKSNTSTGEFFLDLRKQFDHYDDIKRTTGFRKTVTPDNLKLINGDFYSVQKLQINEDGTISITSDNAGYQKNVINNSRILNNNLKGNKPVEAVRVNDETAISLDSAFSDNLDTTNEPNDKIKSLVIDLLKYHYPGKITKEIEESLKDENVQFFYTQVSKLEALLYKEYVTDTKRTNTVYNGLYYKYEAFTFEIPNVTNLVFKAFKNEYDEEKINNIIKDFESTIKPGNKLKATPYSNYLELSKQNDKILLNYTFFVGGVETEFTRVSRKPKLIDLAKDTKMVSMVNQSTKELVSVEAVSKQFVGMSNIIETIVKGQPFQEALEIGNAKIVDGVPFFKIAGKGRDYFIPYFYISANVENMVADDDNAVALEKAFLEYIQKVNNNKSISIDNLKSLLSLDSRDLLFYNKGHKSLLNVTMFYPDVILKRKEPKTLEEIESIIKTEEFTTSESTLGKLTLALAFNSAYEEKNLNYDLTRFNERVAFLSSDDTSIDEVKQDNIFKNFLLNVNRGKEEDKTIKSEEDINNLAEEFKELLKEISKNLNEKNKLVSLNTDSQNSLNVDYGTELLLALSAFDKIPVITENTVLGQEMLIPASPFLSKSDFGMRDNLIEALESNRTRIQSKNQFLKDFNQKTLDSLNEEKEVYKKLKKTNDLSKDEIKEVLGKLESYYIKDGKFLQVNFFEDLKGKALRQFLNMLEENSVFQKDEKEFFTEFPFIILGLFPKDVDLGLEFLDKEVELITSLRHLTEGEQSIIDHYDIVDFLQKHLHVNTNIEDSVFEKAIEQINLEINIANTYTDQNVIRKSLAEELKTYEKLKEVNNLSKDEIKEVLSKLESYYIKDGSFVTISFSENARDRSFLRFLHDLKETDTFKDNTKEFFEEFPFIILGISLPKTFNFTERKAFRSKNENLINSLKNLVSEEASSATDIVLELEKSYHLKDHVNVLTIFKENSFEKAIDQINLEINIANTYT